MKKESVALRIILIASIIILLIIPLLMVQSLITDRQNYRQEAVNEISKGWAGVQIIAGPMITVSQKTEKTDNKGEQQKNPGTQQSRGGSTNPVTLEFGEGCWGPLFIPRLVGESIIRQNN